MYVLVQQLSSLYYGSTSNPTPAAPEIRFGPSWLAVHESGGQRGGQRRFESDPKISRDVLAGWNG
jgi:hypothetical protein